MQPCLAILARCWLCAAQINKKHPKDFFNQSRVRVLLVKETGEVRRADVPNKYALLCALGKMIPKLESRKQRLLQRQQMIEKRQEMIDKKQQELKQIEDAKRVKKETKLKKKGRGKGQANRRGRGGRRGGKGRRGRRK